MNVVVEEKVIMYLSYLPFNNTIFEPLDLFVLMGDL